MMSAKQRVQIFLMVLCLAFSSFCYAIGFGELKVYSYLGEPLYAEVALLGYQGMDPQMLKVGLADAKDFARAGLERPYFLTFINFQILAYDDELFVVIRTAKPVQSPYLEFLIELSWPGGNLIKEYTVLLDPPRPDLTKETRPKGVSQISEEKAREQALAVDSIQQQINLQKAQQQKAEIEKTLTSVNRDGNKFSDQTFDYNEPTTPADLVPGAVPEVLDDEVYQQQRADFEKQQQEKTKQKETKKSLLSKVVSGIDEVQSTFEPDLNVNKILEEEQKNAAAAAPQTTPQAPAIPQAPPVAAPTSTPSDTPSLMPGQQIDQINFSEVIPPVGGPKNLRAGGMHARAAPTATSDLGVPTGTEASAPAEKSNYLYLGIILSLFLIAAGIGVAIKRGLLTAFLAKHHTDTADAAFEEEFVEEVPTTKDAQNAPVNNDVPVSDHPDDKLLTEGFEEFTSPIEQDVEQIELSTPADVTPAPTSTPEPEPAPEPTPAPAPNTGVDLAAMQTQPVASAPIADESLQNIEQEFENINLDEFGVPSPPEQPPLAPSEQPAPAPIEQPPVAPPEQPTPEQPPPVPPEQPAAESEVTGPTLVQYSTGDLKLGEEGASLIQDSTSRIDDNSEVIRAKLVLAKQYLDTGDRESAKELLREIIEVAKDDQRLEAQMLLSSIV